MNRALYVLMTALVQMPATALAVLAVVLLGIAVLR